MLANRVLTAVWALPVAPATLPEFDSPCGLLGLQNALRLRALVALLGRGPLPVET